MKLRECETMTAVRYEGLIFMTNNLIKFLSCSILVGTLSASAQVTITPLTSFGVNGWDAPGANAYLTTGTTERSLTFADGDVFLTSRASGNSIVALNATTGAVIGTLNTTGISGGTFAIDAVAAGADGALYIANLTTSAASPLKIYEYANPLSLTTAPTLVYSGNPIIGTRFGDDLAAIGSGSSTMLVAGSGAGSSGYELINPTLGTATAVSFTGSPPTAGDFRLGVTFTDSSHVLGTQGTITRYSSFSGSTGTLLASPALNSVAERPVSYVTTTSPSTVITTWPQ